MPCEAHRVACGYHARPMARSPLMQLLQRVARSAAARDRAIRSRRTRAATFCANAARARRRARALPRWTPLAQRRRGSRVVIVGGGLAGLAAAYELAKAGVRATLLEGSPRLGGRCWTERERIRRRPDRRARRRAHRHHARGHSRAVPPNSRLPLDDLVAAEPAGSEALFFFDGAAYTTADVDRDFAQVRPRLAADAKVARRRPADVRQAHAGAARSSIACRRRSGSTSRVPGGTRSRFGQLLVNAYGEELGGDPDEISAVTVVVAARGLARGPLLAVRGIRPALSHPRRQRPARHPPRRESRRQIETRSRLMALSRRGDGRYRARRPARRAPSARRSPIA